jgi:3D (Asp-Asp-Asp) domain-containing protein
MRYVIAALCLLFIPACIPEDTGPVDVVTVDTIQVVPAVRKEIIVREIRTSVVTTRTTTVTLPTVASKPRWRPVDVTVYAYCPCKRCCGKWAKYGLTASGGSAWLTGIAADWSVFPKGTVINVPGYGVASVDDKGGDAIRGMAIDIRYSYHWQARKKGVQQMTVYVLEE